jgi:hypothetical protein
MKTTDPSLQLGKFLLLLILPSLASCEGTTTAPPSAAVNDFPTQARVEYVLQCMQEHGGQTYDTMYHCVCMIDKIASKMPYEELTQAQTFTYLFNTPGERGAEFRDPPQSAKLRNQLKETQAQAAQTCFPETPKSSNAKTEPARR